MDVGLAVAGLLTVALGLGHETLGVVWVLPRLDAGRLEPTPFGSPGMTRAMISASWHLITVFVLSMSAVLLTFAWAPDTDPRTLVLRALAVAWVSAAIVASTIGLRGAPRARDVLRLPVPIFFAVVGVLCWVAST